MINYHQNAPTIMRNNTYDNSTQLYLSNSKPNRDHLLMIRKPKYTPYDDQKRRHTITHVTMPEPIVRCSVSNQAYDKTIRKKPLITSNISSTRKETNPKSTHSLVSSNIEVKQMDFRPLIINGRRRFSTIPAASPMVIIKKKSLSPMNNTPIQQVCV